MADLILKTSLRGNDLRILVIGALDLRTADDFESRMKQLVNTAGRSGWIVVDLRCCTGVDLAGLTALAAVRTAAQLEGADFRLESVPPLVAQLIRHHGLQDRLLSAGQPSGSPHQSHLDTTATPPAERPA